MYFVIVVALTLVAPIGSTIAELVLHPGGAIPVILGKWMVLYACGVRLLLAGLRQTFTPKFTLREIFEIEGDAPLQIVQELGFSNICMGFLGCLALLHPVLTFAGAITGGLYYGLAGLKHALTKGHNANRVLAMLTDFLVFAVCATYVALVFPTLLPT